MVEGKGFCDLLPWEFFLSQNFLFFNYTNDPLFFIIDNVRGVIERAMNHWMERVRCLRFVRKTSSYPGRYLSFFSGGG